MWATDPTSNRRYWIWRTPRDRFNPIDTDRLQERLPFIWGEAYQLYLDERKKQPEGELWLDLRSKEAILEQEEIAEASRKRTAVEEIADVIEEWLNTPREAHDIDVEAGPEFDGEDLVVRNMVTPMDAYRALYQDPRLHAYRNADVRTFGRALAKVPGWREIGRVRRHGSPQAVWFCRGKDGPLWVPAPKDQADDLLD